MRNRNKQKAQHGVALFVLKPNFKSIGN